MILNVFYKRENYWSLKHEQVYYIKGVIHGEIANRNSTQF